MGKMPWTRSRSNGSRLQTGLISRRRSRRLKKRVQFQKELQKTSTITSNVKCTAARSLFTAKTIEDLPNEMITEIVMYFDAMELMTLRAVNKRFQYIIDFNNSLWGKVSYRNMWPGNNDRSLFRRGADANNIECLTKLGLDDLYHYNLSVGEEKNKKEVKMHSMMAASYLHNLDVNISPKKPLTWMLIRPPWSASRSICLKHLVYKQLLKFKNMNSDGTVSYNLGRVLSLDTEENDNKQTVTQNFKESSKHLCTHATFELLLSRKVETYTDAGNKLNWLRELKECAVSGNTDALFEFTRCIISTNAEFQKVLKFNDISQVLFKECFSSRIDKLEQYQPKINSLMRCILVDWLAEVAYMKDMSHQVLHAAVNYVDRFLMSRIVERTKLQLLGISCLLLAAKSHYDTRQVHILTVRESSWLTDQTYQYEDVVKMMGEIIGNFRGNLWMRTSWNYLSVLHSSTLLDEEWKIYSHYLHDTILQFTSFGTFKPSQIACATVLLAGLILLKDDPWPKLFIETTGYEFKDIVNCATLIHYKSFTCPSMKDDRNLPLESIKERYTNARNFNVAILPVPTDNELKSRILSLDTRLSCTSLDPLHFVVPAPLDLDDTMNVSIKSADYDGDSEASLDSESEYEDQSFCVGRTRLSSYHSMEDFSDDETTMDANGHFGKRLQQYENNEQQKAVHLPNENFTPIFHHPISSSNNINQIDNQDSLNGKIEIFFGDIEQNNNCDKAKFFDVQSCQRKEKNGAAQGNSFHIFNQNHNAFVGEFGNNDVAAEPHCDYRSLEKEQEASCSSSLHLGSREQHQGEQLNTQHQNIRSHNDRGKRVVKRKHRQASLRSDPVGKRTRSNSLHKF